MLDADTSCFAHSSLIPLEVISNMLYKGEMPFDDEYTKVN